MSDLKKRFNAIVDDLEQHIKQKEDLDYIKTQIYNVAIIFLDELDRLVEMNFSKLNAMLAREKELSNKIARLENALDELEKEVYENPEEGDCDFEIVCPYCNAEFVEDFSNGIVQTVKCPSCGNNIELDWHEKNGMFHDFQENMDDDLQMEYYDDDDMEYDEEEDNDDENETSELYKNDANIQNNTDTNPDLNSEENDDEEQNNENDDDM